MMIPYPYTYLSDMDVSMLMIGYMQKTIAQKIMFAIHKSILATHESSKNDWLCWGHLNEMNEMNIMNFLLEIY